MKGMRACPSCGQDFLFVAKSQQVAEDLCEIWVECVCGHDPDPRDHLESVMGALDKDSIQEAAWNWNAVVERLQSCMLKK